MLAPAAAALDEIRRALSRRFQTSEIDLASPEHAGTVTRRGALVTTRAPVPATPFRVLAVGGAHRVLQHVMDFARVDVRADGTVEVESTPLTVPKGTPLVILDVQVTPDAVHLLTHTAKPLPAAASDQHLYGCTEFVFHLTPTELAADSAPALMDRIQEWLAGPAGTRVCRGGLVPVCIEP